MLRELRVKNFAIIESLGIEFGPGLNVLTGETGAGKSIIVGALGIVLGQRGYTELIKTGADEAGVEAFFDLPGHPKLKSMDIPDDGGILIRRTINRSGKGKAYVNDTMVSIQALADLGDTLVDVHGQHEHQSLLSTDNQMDVLDAFGQLAPVIEKVALIYADLQKLEARLSELRRNARERAQRIDLLKFQVEEIEAANLTEGEDMSLASERDILANQTKLKSLAEESYDALYSADGSAVENLSKAAARMRDIAAIDQSAADAASTLEQALAMAEDASHTVRGYKDKYELDPQRLDAVEERLETIKSLKRKYGESISDVIAYKERAGRDLHDLEHADEAAEGIEKELDDRRKDYDTAAADLTKRRNKAAARIADSVKAVLKTLAFSGFEFRVDVREASPGPRGSNSVEFMFSANAGEDAKALHKVASGGELSRIMLALKCVMQQADNVPVLVFDEVDAGIGGKTAQNVADRLKDSAKGRQVLCITHLPQIASAADRHYMIKKAAKSGRVAVEVREIVGKERQEEIARMLSGDVTETSLKHAGEIIGKRK